ncbi:MAG: hypothetical protein GKS06_08200 [Acidobacteria bacterium]|nr:hypothetical protein [Acidobacteriota bacterium]
MSFSRSTQSFGRVVVLLLGALGLGACASGPPPSTDVQQGVADFELPPTGPPAFAAGMGPRVAIDEAHGNFHTVDGRYRSFAELLRRDGYTVDGFASTVSAEVLAELDLLVISNALAESRVQDWILPNVSAFTPDEIAALEKWVESGGNLLLIADHMPMPGAVADLAEAFGLYFHDGFAYLAEGSGRMSFRRAEGTLAEHAVTSGTAEHPIDVVTTFTGQAFRVASDVDATPLLLMPHGSYILLPSVAWEFTEATPRIPADGMTQGTLIRHGGGRVAAFGEAAAFSAQVQVRNGERFPMGMNDPDAPHNARFLLNVIAWLTESR